jgi:tetratricopeptide (TPR) repeat protein
MRPWRVAGLAALGALATAAMAPSWQPPRGPEGQPTRDRLERAYSESNRGVAYLEQYDYPAAAAAFRGALQIVPSLPAAHLDLAIALLYAGQTADARPEGEAAAKALPDAPQPPFVLGLIARADNRSEDAERAFRRVLQIDPADAASNVNLGQLLLQKRQYPDAVAAFRAAVAAEPYNATAAYGLAMGLMRSGDTASGQQAMAAFQKLRDSQYAVTYAQGYLQQGRYAEAIASTGSEPGLVDTASPAVSFAPVDAAISGQSLGGAADAVLFDADGDGDLDLLALGGSGPQLFRNDGGRFSPTDLVPRSAADKP